MSFNTITSYVFFKSLSRIVAHYSHVIYACYPNMPQNLFCRVLICDKYLCREVIYILTNNPLYLYHKCIVLSLHINDFTFIAHAQKLQSDAG